MLWRHGQTDWNIENRFQGHSDIPLNATGIVQARRAAPLLMGLHPRKIISSDLQRARQTAQALADIAKLPIEIDAGLRETNGGKWEGKTGAQNRAEDYERFVTWLDGNDEPAGETGERRSEIANRAVSAIDRALGDFETLIVVTHGGTARTVIGKMLELPMNKWSVIGGLSNASWSILERGAFHRDGWVLVEHNAGSLPEPIYGEESGA